MSISSTIRYWTVLLIGVFVLLAGPAQAEGGSDPEFFERQIRPLLATHCWECHGTTGTAGGGLRLDTAEHAAAGGQHGPAWSRTAPESSPILQVLQGPHPKSSGAPVSHLPKSASADLRRWIASGARWPAPPAAPSTASALIPGAFHLVERKQRLPWIWEKPHASTPPAVNLSAWSSKPVDRFVLARLETAGLRPAAPCDASTWLRRVSFAVTGLPPSIADIEAFQSDRSENARERVVDRLLASPRFGERWARHWMDLVRYAESRGHEGDYVLPNAYEYRDYLIRALNANIRYDQLIREHVAGDLLNPPRKNPVEGFNESVIATGWAFLGEEIHAPVDTRQDECDRIDNRIDVFTKTFLGLTVSCARCHDHKFDAISQKDYYALAGFFISSGYRQVRFENQARDAATADRLNRLHRESDSAIRTGLAASVSPVLDRLDDLVRTAATVARKIGAVDATGGVHYHATNELQGGWKEIAASESAAAKLDARLVERWTVGLLRAATGGDDSLKPIAAAAFGLPSPSSVHRESAPAARPAKVRVLADYSSPNPPSWVADGLAFGSAPTPAGSWRVVEKAGRPELRLATRSAAVTDPVWSRVKTSPGVETEPAMYGSWNRSGRLLRAPKQMLESGHLHYLVRGGGRVLASVDSQVLVTGPIHTVLVKEWPTSKDWRWVSHDLADYQGHRVGLEFTPGPDTDLELATIVESDTPPPIPVREAASPSPGGSVHAVIESWSGTLRAAVDSYAAGHATPAVLDRMDWELSHPDLFSGVTNTFPEPLQSAVGHFLSARKAIEETIRWESRTTAALLDGNGVDEFLLKRGSPGRAEGEVPRRFLEAVSGPDPIAGSTGSGRQELAAVLTDPANPLVARVMVNRVWHHLFGRGLVPTVDNFGYLGERPSHPELLDYLAVQFVEEDQWSLKRLIRRLVLTETFAMDSRVSDPVAEEKDPDNRLLHRAHLKRLEGEAIRDSILAVSGRLEERMYGVGVPLHPPSSSRPGGCAPSGVRSTARAAGAFTSRPGETSSR